MDPETKVVNKCDMCYDRVTAGKLPSCVLACPTGTMNFGEREDMLKLAKTRLAELKKKWPNATLADPDDVSVIFLLIDTPDTYHEHAVAEAAPVSPMTKKQLFAKLASPIKAMKA